MQNLMGYVRARGNLVQPIWMHRFTLLGVIFSFIIALLAFLLGVFVPTKISPRNTDITNISAAVDDYHISRDICYYMAYLGWGTRYIPQMILNNSRGRTVGLCIDGLLWNLLGNGCYMLSTIIDLSFIAPQSKMAQSDSENTKQAAFGCLIFLLSGLLLVQCLAFDSLKFHGFSPIPLSAVAVVILLSIIFLIVLLSSNVTISHFDSISAWVQVLKYVYISCSIMKFVPQIRRNIKYKIFLGYDLMNLFLDFCGGACLILYILFSCPGGAFIRNRNERCVLASMVIDAMPQIVHGSSVCILAITLFVQCVMYTDVSHLSQLGRSDEIAPAIIVDVGRVNPGNVENSLSSTLPAYLSPEGMHTNWTCFRCTLVNESQMEFCEVCNFRRTESMHASSKSLWLDVPHQTEDNDDVFESVLGYEDGFEDPVADKDSTDDI